MLNFEEWDKQESYDLKVKYRQLEIRKSKNGGKKGQEKLVEHVIMIKRNHINWSNAITKWITVKLIWTDGFWSSWLTSGTNPISFLLYIITVGWYVTNSIIFCENVLIENELKFLCEKLLKIHCRSKERERNLLLYRSSENY